MKTNLKTRGHSIPGFGNLSLHQLSLLIHKDWSSDTPGLQLCYDLTTGDLSGLSYINPLSTTNEIT